MANKQLNKNNFRNVIKSNTNNTDLNFDLEEPSNKISPSRVILTSNQVKKCYNFYKSAINNIALRAYNCYHTDMRETSTKEMVDILNFMTKFIVNLSVNCGNTELRDSDLDKLFKSYNNKFGTILEENTKKDVYKYLGLNNKDVSNLSKYFFDFSVEECLETLIESRNSDEKINTQIKFESFIYDKINTKILQNTRLFIVYHKTYSNNPPNFSKSRASTSKRSINANNLSLTNSVKISYIPLGNNPRSLDLREVYNLSNISNEPTPCHSNQVKLNYTNSSAMLNQCSVIVFLFFLIFFIAKKYITQH